MGLASELAAKELERISRQQEQQRWVMFATEILQDGARPYFNRVIEHIESELTEFNEKTGATIVAQRENENYLHIRHKHAPVNKTHLVFNPQRSVIAVERDEQEHPLAAIRHSKAEVRLTVEVIDGQSFVTSDVGDTESCARAILLPILSPANNAV